MYKNIHFLCRVLIISVGLCSSCGTFSTFLFLSAPWPWRWRPAPTRALVMNITGSLSKLLTCQIRFNCFSLSPWLELIFLTFVLIGAENPELQTAAPLLSSMLWICAIISAFIIILGIVTIFKYFPHFYICKICMYVGHQILIVDIFSSIFFPFLPKVVLLGWVTCSA